MVVATYQVTGLTCEHCVRAVTGELAGIEGVRSVGVSLVPGGESRVTVTSEAELPVPVVAAALAEAGDYQISHSQPDGGRA